MFRRRMKMGGQFRNSTWDPILIISQIFALQFVIYCTLGIWNAFTTAIAGLPRSLDCLFSYQYIHVRDNTGQLVITSFVINSLTGALALWFIVQRTKQCLDFSATAHLIHLFVCWSYNGYFPVSMSWWVLNTVCLAIMCVCGEFLCMRTELKSIPLNMGPKADL
ncbi:protein SYS1 homolog isoform X2 [Cloeon dipterum]